jgi:hypothetical protein
MNGADIAPPNTAGFCRWEISSRQDVFRVYDGIAGDVLTGGMFLTEERLRLYEQEKLEELAEKILAPEGYLPKFLSRAAYREFARDKAVAQSRQRARASHESAESGWFVSFLEQGAPLYRTQSLSSPG